MRLWKRFKTWALDEVSTFVEQSHESMVGEPVISFIQSLHREGSRRYKFSNIDRVAYKGTVHSWMNFADFYELVDAKTGNVFQAYLHDYKLHAVHGLPFDLNGWEKEAIFEAFQTYRQPARDRRSRMRMARAHRERAVQIKREAMLREEFAQQFRESVA